MTACDFTGRFHISDPNLIYLDGNSLGRLPLQTVKRLEQLIQRQWGEDLIAGWNLDWIHLPRRIGDQIGDLIGAAAGQCVVADSTSVNLFKLAAAALQSQGKRANIVSDLGNFPSDLYVLQSAAKAAGGQRKIITVGTTSDVLPATEQVIDAIDADTALVCLSHVNFRSGSLYPMLEITRDAHNQGALVLWDLSHSVGVVPMQLDDWKVDLAVGCTYKYLCGGPGAPAFLYVRQDLQEKLHNPIAGWFSHQQPFAFDSHYEAAVDIQRFVTGTPPVLSLAAIEAGVSLVAEAGLESIRQKSVALTQQFIEAYDAELMPLGFELRTPRDSSLRGSHVSLGHPEARRITQTLIEKHKVVPDFRAPDNLRLGFAPLYNNAREVTLAVEAIAQVVRETQYEQIVIGNAPVT
jgi:kynureninase